MVAAIAEEKPTAHREMARPPALDISSARPHNRKRVPALTLGQ
jgi:hypothetical protein